MSTQKRGVKKEEARKAFQELMEKLEGKEASTSTKGGGEAGCSKPGKPFIQIAARMLVNAEALNMVESIGNVTRHRTIPVIVAKAPGNYLVRWVPAVSGETLAHRYQEEIVDLALASEKCRNRLDYWSTQKEFLKHWDLKFYSQQCERKDVAPADWECELARNYAAKRDFSLNDIANIEKTIVANSVVEDIAGFLVTQGPTRRTSCVKFSYALPTRDAIEVSQVDHQMHVRGALKAQSLRLKGYEEAIQVPYYVQVGSVLYGFNVELDLGCVGCLSISGKPVEDKECSVDERRCIAVKALRPILDGDFGAKRSRYRPHNVLELAIAVVSDKPIPIPPATLAFNQLLDELREKLQAYSGFGVEYRVAALVPPATGYREEIVEALKNKLGVSEENIVADTKSFIEKLQELSGLKCGGGSQ